MKSASKKLYGRGQNWSKVTTTKLKEILSHPHCIGSDGKDYEPYKHELEQELWKRQNIETEKSIAAWDREFKRQLKEQSKTIREKSA